MKKIFTTLIAGSLIVTTGIEVKANTANTNLQNSTECEEGMVGSYYFLLALGHQEVSADLETCYGFQKNAINTNASDIDTNTSAIETLQGASSSADITANTNKINTNTSNINSLGEGVAGSTALTAALSALPQMSKESKTTCGVGTGAYSSRYAVGFGCASKVSKRIDVNAGGSYVFGGSKSYGGGTLDSGVVKAGFVFKLGELNKPTQISFKDKKIMDNKISSLEKNNDELKAKNNQIISQNQKLLARLENLEKLTSALKLNPDSEVISLAKQD